MWMIGPSRPAEPPKPMVKIDATALLAETSASTTPRLVARPASMSDTSKPICPLAPA